MCFCSFLQCPDSFSPLSVSLFPLIRSQLSSSDILLVATPWTVEEIPWWLRSANTRTQRKRDRIQMELKKLWNVMVNIFLKCNSLNDKTDEILPYGQWPHPFESHRKQWLIKCSSRMNVVTIISTHTHTRTTEHSRFTVRRNRTITDGKKTRNIGLIQEQFSITQSLSHIGNVFVSL